MQQAAESVEDERHPRHIRAQPPDYRGAPTDGHDGQSVFASDGQHPQHLVVTARAHHRIGDVVDDARSTSCVVDEGGAAGRTEPGGAPLAHVLIADRTGQGRESGCGKA
jgi:hypothetical protein